jgi:C1A family cysteine protease
MFIALHYYKENFAILESDYPYTSGKGVRGECEAKEKPKTKVEISSATEVLPADEAQFKAALAKQPLSIAVAASKPAFHQYTSGIITKDCGLQLDHGVLAVGYGTDETSGQEYYVVKNSWGPTWGEKGFVRVGVEAGPGVCGIHMEPSYPTAKA